MGMGMYFEASPRERETERENGREREGQQQFVLHCSCDVKGADTGNDHIWLVFMESDFHSISFLKLWLFLFPHLTPEPVTFRVPIATTTAQGLPTKQIFNGCIIYKSGLLTLKWQKERKGIPQIFIS